MILKVTCFDNIKNAKLTQSQCRGYSEAALVGALAVRLNGPNRYGGVQADKPYIGINLGPDGADHIERACEWMLYSAFMVSLLAWGMGYKDCSEPMTLKIEIDGEGMDLFIAEITRDQLQRLEKASAFWGKFYWKKSLQNLWYLNEAKMTELFGVASFRQMKSGNHRYLGPVLRTKSGLDAFLEKIGIQEDNRPRHIDAPKIRTRFQPMADLPTLTDTNAVVFHGEHYLGTTVWDIQADPPFNLKQLRLNFIDCGDNGHILQSVSYRGSNSYAREEAHHRGFLKLQFMLMK